MLILEYLVASHRSFSFSLFSFISLSQITYLIWSIFTFIVPFFWELTSVMKPLYHFFLKTTTFQHQYFLFFYENNLYLSIDIINIDLIKIIIILSFSYFLIILWILSHLLLWLSLWIPFLMLLSNKFNSVLL